MTSSSHRYAELLGALVAVAILEESHPQGGGVAWIDDPAR